MTASPSTVFVSGSGSGVFRASFDPETGKLGRPEVAAAFGAASWMAPHPFEPVLYTSLREGAKQGIASWSIGADGNLSPQSELLLEVGTPTHIAVNPEGTLLATSHYSGAAGTLIALEADGSLKGPALITPHTLDAAGPRPQQTQARPHFVAFTDNGRRVHQVDLGTDEIWTFEVETDPLSQTFSHKVRFPSGYGPRHLGFHPSMRFAYVSGELGAKVSVLQYDEPTATFTPVQHLDSRDTSVAEPYNNTSHILVHPNGRFVYVGNRGHDSIGVFAINGVDGTLRFVETEPVRAHWPRHFTIDPSGRWLLVAGARSGTVGVMAIDPDSGALSFHLDSIVEVPDPVCLLIL